jgi:hypothetical protein
MSSLGNNYERILGYLLESNLEHKVEALKRLCTLAIADRREFALYSRKITSLLEGQLAECKAAEVQYQGLLLVSALVSQAPRETEQGIRLRVLPLLVPLLGHPEGQVRKATHNALLQTVRTYRCFDFILTLYARHGLDDPDPVVQQKAINSLQSLVIMEAKQLSMASEDFRRVFLKLLAAARKEDLAVKKAGEQCLITLCKMQPIKAFAKSLEPEQMTHLREFFYKQKEMGVFTPDVAI